MPREIFLTLPPLKRRFDTCMHVQWPFIFIHTALEIFRIILTRSKKIDKLPYYVPHNGSHSKIYTESYVLLAPLISIVFGFE